MTDYDRAAAAHILARVAAQWAPEVRIPAPLSVEPQVSPLSLDRSLTTAQRAYLHTDLATSATHKVMWHDSTGVLNVAHCSSLGPVVPVVARETTIRLRDALSSDTAVRAAAVLTPHERRTMVATTTDADPIEILAVGFETTARALVQHAYLADSTPYSDPATLALGLRDSGIFAVVANTWYWGLQSSTFRRGMIPIALEPRPDGGVRYTSESTAILRSLKAKVVAAADLPQYAGLPAGEQPRCLANMSTDRRPPVLPGLIDLFVRTFVDLLGVVTVISPPATSTIENRSLA